MKKILSIILVLALALSMAACKSDDETVEKNTYDTSEGTENEEQEPEPKEPVTLEYLAWNLGTEEENNLERLMLQKYQELNEHVTIEIVTPGEGESYDDLVATLAAAGNLPDVFMWARVPEAVANDWVLDISTHTKEDAEWSSLPNDLIDSITYGGSVYTVPFAIHLGGYFINKDIFNELNIDPLKYGFTWEEFEAAARMTSVPAKKLIGLEGAGWERIIEIYPAVMSDDYGWFAYDGEELALNSDFFKEGMEKSVEMFNNEYTAPAVDGATYFEGVGWPWGEGHIAMNYDGSWAFGWMPTSPDITWNFDFVGLPSGKVVIIPDFIFVAKTTEHPEEAFELAKFMGYAKEGYLARVKLAEENELTVNSMPIVIDEEIMGLLEETYKPYPQLLEVIRNMQEDGIVEIFKTTPGYIKARWQAATGIVEEDADGNEKNLNLGDIFWQASRGMRNYADIADEVNRIANEEIQKEKDALK